MRLHGVLMVRDGVATLRASLLHHLSLGCERIHVVDNGSSDGTTTVLKRLARRTPITWSRDPGPYQQHEVVTALVREAAREGADWVLPFDHDEFWISRDRLHDVLERAGAQGAGAVRARLVNFAQRRDVVSEHPRALLSMVYRAPDPVEPIRAQELVEEGQISFLEYDYPPKLVVRAGCDVDVQRGAHWSRHLLGPVLDAEGVEILHAPLLARVSLDRKAEFGRRLLEADYVDRECWHNRRWAAMADANRLDDEWKALSVEAGGWVEVADGIRRRFVHDTRLRDTVARYLRTPAKQAAARALARSY